MGMHRFAALLDRRNLRRDFAMALKPHISETFQWVLSILVPFLIGEFRVCTRYEQKSPFFGPSFTKIQEVKGTLVGKIGDFVWKRAQHGLDCELANQLTLDYQYGSKQEILDGKRLTNELCRGLNIRLPCFLQAMDFLLSYQEIIAKKIQFEERARDLPPRFLVALVFAGKNKRLIPLEVSDVRILNWAAYLKVDVSCVDAKMEADESRTEIPFALADCM
jgi:hypothetical protein